MRETFVRNVEYMSYAFVYIYVKIIKASGDQILLNIKSAPVFIISHQATSLLTRYVTVLT